MRDRELLPLELNKRDVAKIRLWGSSHSGSLRKHKIACYQRVGKSTPQNVMKMERDVLYPSLLFVWCNNIYIPLLLRG